MLRHGIALVVLLGACSFTVQGASSGDGVTDAPWYAPGWQRRQQLEIDPARVGSGGVTDFPVLVSRTEVALRDHARADGGDILFTAADGTTKLSHEIERYTSTTGELIAWVKLPRLSSTVPTMLYVYYGNPAASDQQDAASVWDASFRGVWHLSQTTGGTGAIADSTSHANHGTDRNGPLLGAAGQIGLAVSFVAGGNDQLDMGTSASLSFGAGEFSVSAWIRPTDGTVDYQAIVARVLEVNPWTGWVFQIGPTDDHVHLWIDGTDNAAASGVVLGTWSHVTWTRSGGTIRLYVNGVQTATGASSADVNAPTRPLKIGYTEDWNDFRGTVDEVRVAAVALPAAWIATGYNNEISPATFVANVGADQVAP